MSLVSKVPLQKNDTLMSPKTLGAYLGISRASVYRLVERREIPFYRLRSGLRFKQADVDEYLLSRRVETISNK